MGQQGHGTGRLRSIGAYTLLDRVGAGGMGVVYRALDRRSGTVVAFKLLHEHVAADPSAVERFRREAHVASLLRSSYAVQTLEFGSDEGRYFLVSEFVDGRSLADIMAEGRPEPLAAIAIVSQAALALDEAESRQITHRDIKPDNILVTEDGSVKLADFGIASLRYLSGLTQAGSYIGTVAYSAPEQHRGKSDIRSDLYSLGVVLYELLAGRRPFEAPSAPELMRLHEEVPVPLEGLSGLPPKLAAVVQRCLEKDPVARYQHPSELLAALDAVRPAVAGAGAGAADSWMESAVAGLGATGLQAMAAASPVERPAMRENEAPPAASPPAATNVGAQPLGAPGETRIGASPLPAPESGGGRKLPRRPLLAVIAVAAAAAIVAFATALALGGGDGDEQRANGGSGGETATPTATATATGTATTTPASPSPSVSATAQPSGAATFVASPRPSQAPAVPIDPTATPRPATATPTTVPPTPTATPPPPPPSYSSPIFATTLTASGLPPAGGVPSGGTLGGCPITSVYAYVTHMNVPIGTELTGSWSFQGTFQASNPTFATDAVNGATNYNFGNPQGLPQGTYTFVLRSGLTQRTAGTVKVAC